MLSEVAELWEKNDTKVMEDLIEKYTEIISLLEIEAFTKGVAFMKELKLITDSLQVLELV